MSRTSEVTDIWSGSKKCEAGGSVKGAVFSFSVFNRKGILMFGLLYLAAFLGFFLLSGLVAWIVATFASEAGRNGKKWGTGAMILMVGLVFWDWLPMEVMFSYNCAQHAGYTQFKTLEQWKEQNPGVAETLAPAKEVNPIKEGNRKRRLLNQRFAWDTIRTDHWFHIRKHEERIVDIETGEVMAEYVDFDTDIPALGLGVTREGAYKIWMMKDSCEEPGKKNERKLFFGFESRVEKIGAGS